MQKIHGAPYWRQGSSEEALRDFALVLGDWCRATKDATTPATVEAQPRPENRWEVHPDVDGCTPAGPEGPH